MSLLPGDPRPERAVRRILNVPELPLQAPVFVVDAWELARSGVAVDVETEVRALAVLDHPEFYVLHTHDREIPDRFEVQGVNPRLHVLLHELIETQLIQNDPPEAAQAVAHLLDQGVDRHRALHLVMDGLIPEIHTALREGQPADIDRYRRHLAQLSQARATGSVAAPGPQSARPGRNDPCPCGSGRKYKRCCGAQDAVRLITPAMGRMLLGAGRMALPRYLEQATPGDDYLLMENLAAVAHALEQAGAPGPAAAAHRQLVAEAEARGLEDAVHNALYDLQEFALNHPEHAEDGIWATNRLLAQEADPGQVAQLRLDLADLYEAAGDPGRADALFREVMAGDPPEPLCHLRWARRLADAGDLAEAEAVYRRVMQRNGRGERSAAGDAARELAELLAAQGREDEAAELGRQGRR